MARLLREITLDNVDFMGFEFYLYTSRSISLRKHCGPGVAKLDCPDSDHSKILQTVIYYNTIKQIMKTKDEA